MWLVTVFGGRDGRTIKVGDIIHHQNTLEIKRSEDDPLAHITLNLSTEFKTACLWVVGGAGIAMVLFPLAAWQMTIPTGKTRYTPKH